MIRLSHQIFIVLSLLMISLGAKAQVEWHLTHSDQWKTGTKVDSEVCFTCLDCKGNDCSAGALVIRNPQTGGDKRVTIFRSNDGGVSWHEQPLFMDLPPILTNQGLTKIQQIDSLNVTAIGDSAVIIRTYDGGATWKRQNLPPIEMIYDVHFSDPNIGIICYAGRGGYADQIHTTSDGGRHWNLISVPGFIIQCHSYGKGKFRWMHYGLGPVYTTEDNFKTIDSTGLIFDSLTNPKWNRNLVARCTFGNGDTILGMGKYWPSDTVDLFGGYGLIMRSIDGGKTWERPFIFHTDTISQVGYSTPLDHDTIYAGGQSNNQYLVSTDKGASWKADTILTNTNYFPYACFGLGMPNDGHPVAIFSSVGFPRQSILTKAQFYENNVGFIATIIYYTHIYPNPAKEFVTVESIIKSSPIHVMDILGREVSQGILTDGTVTLNISKLEKGIYSLIMNYDNRSFSVGKILIIR
jgi:photosystem II stability/assembly factor-like uncharacterized protein